MARKTESAKSRRETEIKVLKKLQKERRVAFKRFPVIFTLLVTFGTVITFSGISRLIAKVPLLYNNPVITLLVGVLILLFTGTLYKRL
jgi:hypothetical protein